MGAVRIGLRAWVCGFVLLPAVALAQNTFSLPEEPKNPKEALRMLDESGTVQLPIVGKRFRIDYQVEQITFIFFRERGSAPVVLIQPDGTKWYAANHPRDRVSWHSEAEFDMITVDEPTPGPWQVSGQILENSTAMVVTDVQFHPEPVPAPLYVGETIKVTGTLSNGGEPIETKEFRDVIKLEVIFISSNNPEFDNFGGPPKRVGEFLDNGRDYDERAGDGVFTGAFLLNVQPGEYHPTYRVTTPLLQRSDQQPAVEILPVPLTIEVEKAQRADDDHQLIIDIDSSRIQPDSVAINGKTQFPNADVREFSLTEETEFPTRVSIPNYAFGKYIVDLSLFATDVDGREIQLTVPTVEFIAAQPAEPELTAAEREEQRLRLAAEQAAERERLREQQDQQLIWRLVIIIGANVAIIALGLGAWWFIRRRKAARKATEEQEN